jgi:phage regulator Rha-like protein
MKKENTKLINNLPIPIEFVERRIYLIRGQKVMLDSDLAELYHVLNQAVRRNISRFPEDFMLQLTNEELKNWRSQIVTSNPDARMGLRRPPYAFTEHGVAMLSSVLRSERAVQMNILIIRAFIQMREILASQKDIAEKFRQLEKQQKFQGVRIDVIYKIIEDLLQKPTTSKKPIGFRTN